MSEPPAYLKAFRELIRSEPTFNHLPLMEMEFYGESDRAVILLSAALAELGLEVALKKLFREDMSAEDLFDWNGPLGDFAGKIKLSFALSLFNQTTKHDLDLIRQLRNGFAHSRHPLQFASPQVANMCRHLKLPDTQHAQIPAAYITRAKDVAAARDLKNPKTRYVTTCNTIAVELVTFGRPPAGSRALGRSHRRYSRSARCAPRLLNYSRLLPPKHGPTWA
jgi:DNA-binding MltR family transcriptional regulator